MSAPKALFVSGTGTDVGKTYCTALLAKAMRAEGFDVGYFKAAVSGIQRGADGTVKSDATYVAKVAGMDETHDEMVSFSYETPVSPHLAARIEGTPVDLATIMRDFDRACDRHEYVIVEGSGGIVCPLRFDEERIMLEDVVRAIGAPVLLVADAGLGTLNALATTIAYMEAAGIRPVGIVLNRFSAGDAMHEDNKVMAERLCGIPVIACIPPEAAETTVDPRKLAGLFEEANAGSAHPTDTHHERTKEN